MQAAAHRCVQVLETRWIPGTYSEALGLIVDQRENQPSARHFQWWSRYPAPSATRHAAAWHGSHGIWRKPTRVSLRPSPLVRVCVPHWVPGRACSSKITTGFAYSRPLVISPALTVHYSWRGPGTWSSSGYPAPRPSSVTAPCAAPRRQAPDAGARPASPRPCGDKRALP